jgi:Uncharacterised nucleotidyltransferase
MPSTASPQVIAVAGKAGARDVAAEFNLLLACCSVAGPGQLEKISRLLRLSLNWEKLLDLAERHDVTPRLYQVLSGFAEEVPLVVRERLRLSYQRNAQRSLKLAHELVRILECLESHGIIAIPYKGPVLAELVYGDVGVRQFFDLDILVHPANSQRATAAVHDLGYVPAMELSQPEEHAYLASGYERTFDGPLGKNLLEIQWRLLPRFYAVDWEVDGLFESSSTVLLGGRQMRTLSPEDLFLALCLHAAKHAWARLSWLCDISETMKTQNISYQRVRNQAQNLGIMRIVAVSVLLAHRVLGTPCPAPLVEMDNDEKINSLGKQIRQVMNAADEYDPESLDYFRLMVELRERRRDKLRFLWRLALTPGTGEWSTIRLPAFLFPLHRLVRLGRLTRRLLAQAIS